MKKTFALAALALAALSAHAGVTGFATYDYSRAEGSPYFAQHEGQVGLKLGVGGLGALDIAGVAKQDVTSVRKDTNGVEVGYSNGLVFGGMIAVTGRLGLGQVDRAKYWSAGVEASVPVGSANAFVGFRHRNSFNAVLPAATDRYTLGADLPLAKNVTVRLGVEHSVADQRSSNGVATGLAYGF